MSCREDGLEQSGPNELLQLAEDFERRAAELESAERRSKDEGAALIESSAVTVPAAQLTLPLSHTLSSRDDDHSTNRHLGPSWFDGA